MSGFFAEVASRSVYAINLWCDSREEAGVYAINSVV
jgi:hypothetical protein